MREWSRKGERGRGREEGGGGRKGGSTESLASHLLSLPRFREGKTKVLITNNLSVRGICMEPVTLVVNYDIPMDTQNRVDCDTYLHR